MKKFYKKCGCDGYPGCQRCHGTDLIRDYDMEYRYAEYRREKLLEQKRSGDFEDDR